MVFDRLFIIKFANWSKDMVTRSKRVVVVQCVLLHTVKNILIGEAINALWLYKN